MNNLTNYYIKTNRIFHPVRKYSWMITIIIAIGGLWFPKLGLAVLFIMSSLLTTAFFKGRYWCGNICPHGSLFDLIIQPISRNKRIPNLLKTKPFITLFFLFFVVNLTRRVIKVTAAWGTYQFLDKLGLIFVMTYLVVMVVGGFLALAANPRTWCQFCPMGTLQRGTHLLVKTTGVAKITEKKLTISSKEKCHKCGKCARVCPFQLMPYLEFSENNQFSNRNCIKCSTCVANCPAGILSLETERCAIKLKEDTIIEGYKNRQTIKSTITGINDLAEDVKEYIFTFHSPEKVNYQAGQFILVKIQDTPEAYRAYSISSYPESSEQLSIIIKKVPKGYGTAKIYENFQIGAEIQLEGPIGNELVLNPADEKVLFVANGIGITPFIALAKDALTNLPNLKELKLLAGQRFEKELLYHDYFKHLASQDQRFEYIPVVSRDKESNIRKGYVVDPMKELDLKGYKVYLCGSKNMVTDSYNILLENGVCKEDINYESEEKIKL
ncbi:MAG: 4Fe-4S binding protein [Bacillota bacterium]